MTDIEEIVYVWICVHLEHPDGAVIHLFESDPWEEHLPGHIVRGRAIEGFWEALDFGPDDADKPRDIAAVDRLLLASGYQRLTDWTTRRGRSGNTIYSADGQIRIEDIR